MKTTVTEYSQQHYISESAARYRLEKMVREGKATKTVDPPVLDTGSNLPVKVATYYVKG